MTWEKNVGTGAYLSGLRRHRARQFKIKKAVKLEKITANNWQKYLLSDKMAGTNNLLSS